MPCGRPTEHQTPLDEQRIAYELHRSPRRRKSITVTVEDNSVRVLAPLRTPQRTIDEFVRRRTNWIAQRLDAEQPRGLRTELCDGGRLPLLGVVYPVVAEPASFHFDGLQFLADLSRPDCAARAERWLRNFARVHFTSRVDHWSPVVGASPERIQIRDQKTRWGSASALGTLSFNWRLIFAQPEMVDYVVVHELCHLLEPNHSAAYWRLVNESMPDAQLWRRRLRDVGTALAW
ncbi:MAG: SprT family zinc-dependent metalloprotease [Chloroflexi bacterium]|nr:SprT family zinc-dependent metalloprotease [Chloroflexota bacterium]MCY3696400.1 SprT family zinc-dependent metalloprotease [Chloroflexota bacterium]